MHAYSTSATRAPSGWAAASSTTTWRSSKLLRCAVSPAGPARNAPICSRSTGRAGDTLDRRGSVPRARRGRTRARPPRPAPAHATAPTPPGRPSARAWPARPSPPTAGPTAARPPATRRSPPAGARSAPAPRRHASSSAIPLRTSPHCAHGNRSRTARPQVRLIQRARRLGVLEDRIAMQRRPPPVRAAGQIGRHHVRMQLRLTGAAHPMPIRRRHEPVRRQLDPAGMAATHPARLPLQVPERRAHRLLVRLHQRPRVSSSPIANSTLTLFGAENVRSSEHTRSRPDPDRSTSPLLGSRPPISAPNASASTSPSRPSAARRHPSNAPPPRRDPRSSHRGPAPPAARSSAPAPPPTCRSTTPTHTTSQRPNSPKTHRDATVCPEPEIWGSRSGASGWVDRHADSTSRAVAGRQFAQ